MRYDGVARNLEQLMAATADRAAYALGRLLNAEVRVSCCRLYHGDRREALTESLQGRGALVRVSQTAFGAETIEVSIVIEESRIRHMLDLLMGRHGASLLPLVEPVLQNGARFDPFEIDALKETANIVTGSCIAVLGGELGLTGCSLPSMAAEMPLADTVCSLLPRVTSMCVTARLKASAHALEIVLMISIAGPAASAARPAAVPG
jgi:hypothetical protein